MSSPFSTGYSAGFGPLSGQQDQQVPPDVHSEYQQRQLNMAAGGGPPIPPHVASFTYSPPAPAENQTVTFDASASQPGDVSAPITSYDWLFNGVTQANGVTVTWQIPGKAGSYPVQLTVTSDDDQGDIASQTITV